MPLPSRSRLSVAKLSSTPRLTAPPANGARRRGSRSSSTSASSVRSVPPFAARNRYRYLKGVGPSIVRMTTSAGGLALTISSTFSASPERRRVPSESALRLRRPSDARTGRQSSNGGTSQGRKRLRRRPLESDRCERSFRSESMSNSLLSGRLVLGLTSGSPGRAPWLIPAELHSRATCAVGRHRHLA